MNNLKFNIYNLQFTMVSREEMTPKKRIENAYKLLEEAERMLPVEWGTTECMQASEKIWAAWAQATKAYKHWETTRGYDSIIGELYNNYPKFEDELHHAHRTARCLHRDGFYEGISGPVKKDIEVVRTGIEIIEKILNEKRGKSQ